MFTSQPLIPLSYRRIPPTQVTSIWAWSNLLVTRTTLAVASRRELNTSSSFLKRLLMVL
jgi:hypothetical protein